MADPTPAIEAPKEDGTKEISKGALEKARKKAEKAAKKAEHKAKELVNRPKNPPKSENPTPAITQPTPTSVFEEGWLKRVYGEKPVSVVRTRFPPEPNGYLHIGHAKAIAVNFGFAKFHKGECFLRFDDTNPEKEEDIYFKSIEEIVKWLGFTPYKVTYSSDHFDLLYELAEKLIKKDKAYVCHCTKEEVNLQRGGPDNRGTRFGCKHRTRPIDESLAEFRAMKEGKYKPGAAHLRMKQKIDDPTEGNPQCWDLAASDLTSCSNEQR
jgi:glutaminyl-tRNA synthetase